MGAGRLERPRPVNKRNAACSLGRWATATTRPVAGARIPARRDREAGRGGGGHMEKWVAWAKRTEGASPPWDRPTMSSTPGPSTSTTWGRRCTRSTCARRAARRRGGAGADPGPGGIPLGLPSARPLRPERLMVALRGSRRSATTRRRGGGGQARVRVPPQPVALLSAHVLVEEQVALLASRPRLLGRPPRRARPHAARRPVRGSRRRAAAGQRGAEPEPDDARARAAARRPRRGCAPHAVRADGTRASSADRGHARSAMALIHNLVVVAALIAAARDADLAVRVRAPDAAARAVLRGDRARFGVAHPIVLAEVAPVPTCHLSPGTWRRAAPTSLPQLGDGRLRLRAFLDAAARGRPGSPRSNAHRYPRTMRPAASAARATSTLARCASCAGRRVLRPARRCSCSRGCCPRALPHRPARYPGGRVPHGTPPHRHRPSTLALAAAARAATAAR